MRAPHGARLLFSPDDTGCDRERALYPADLFAWLKETQRKEWAKHEASSKGHAESALLERLLKLMEEHGTLWVLRNPLKAVAAKFDLCQFKPSHGLNPDTLARYQDWHGKMMEDIGDVMGDIADATNRTVPDVAGQVYELARLVAKRFGEDAPEAPANDELLADDATQTN